jgi:hypothetical protein
VELSSKDNELPFRVNMPSPYDIGDVFNYYSSSFYSVIQKDYRHYIRVMSNGKEDKEKIMEDCRNKKAARNLESFSDFPH